MAAVAAQHLGCLVSIIYQRQITVYRSLSLTKTSSPKHCSCRASFSAAACNGIAFVISLLNIGSMLDQHLSRRVSIATAAKRSGVQPSLYLS